MSDYKNVPADPTSEMLQAANAGEIDTIVAMKAWIRMVEASPPSGGEVVMQWHEGLPPKHYGEEWFIALLDNGGKAVLRSLPEEFSYDYTTADETYWKAEKVKKWMQFPDSQYKPYTSPRVVDEAMVLRACNAYDAERSGDDASEYPAMFKALQAALGEGK